MKTKICTHCKKRKLTKYFSFSNRDIDKLADWCKKCVHNYNIKHYQRNADYKRLKYLHEYKYAKWNILLRQIRQRCSNKNHPSYKYYGGKGVKCLITAEELKKLWFRDKAYLMKKPSIHRKKSNKHYIYNNCIFLEISDNVKLTQCKKVYQYDLEGNFIKEWESIAEASRKLKIYSQYISNCINKKWKTGGGYIWTTRKKSNFTKSQR